MPEGQQQGQAGQPAQPSQTPAPPAQGAPNSQVPENRIPQWRFNETNERRKAAEQALAQEQEARRQLEERLASLEQRLQSSDEPDEEDAWLDSKLEKRTKPIEEKLSSVEQAISQVTQFTQSQMQLAAQQQAERELDQFFRQRGEALDEQTKDKMREIYFTQVIPNNLQSAVTLEDVEANAIGKVIQERRAPRIADAVNQQQAGQPDPSVGAPRFTEPGGEEEEESPNIWEAIDTSKPDWQEEFNRRFGDIVPSSYGSRDD